MAEPASPSDAPLRIITRATLAFCVETARRLGEAPGGFERGLLFAAIVHANTEALARSDPSLIVAAMPDADRRPVSVASLARYLARPFETTRRQVAGLRKLGAVAAVDGGLIVPALALRTAPWDAVAEAFGDGFRSMLLELYSLDLNLETFGPEPRRGARALGAFELSLAGLPPSLLGATGGVYFLRLLENVPALYGNDLTRILLMIAVMHLNAQSFAAIPEMAWRYSRADTPPPEGLRKPVSMREIARQLGQPYSTVQRHVDQMVANGLLARRGDGVIIPLEVLQSPVLLGDGSRLATELQRLLKSLFRQGLTA